MRAIMTLIILILFLLFSGTGYCQLNGFYNYNHRIESLSMDQGLSSNVVTNIFQDNNGFIWVGTNAGLNKYDGYEFEKFLYQIDDKNSLSHSFIKDILLGNNSNLWLATWGGGINIFDFEKQEFVNFSEKLETDSIHIHNHVEFIHQSKDGAFWFGTLEGLVHFDPETGSHDKYLSQSADSNSISDNRIIEVLERNDGTMLFVCNDGRLNVFNAKEKNFHRYEIPKKPKKKELVIITKLFEDSKQNLLIGTTNGVYSFNQNTGEFSSMMADEKTARAFSGNRINAILEYGDGLFWLGTADSGIIELEMERDHNKQFFLSGTPNILPYTWIEELLRDVQGNIWIGTQYNGLKVLYNKNKHFDHINLENKIAQSITIDSDNNLWIGSNHGLFKYSLDTKERKRYDVDSGLSSNIIRSLYAEENRLLIGTEKGLDVLNLTSGKITLWREENNILNTPIVKITKDIEGNYWIGSDQKGLIFIDRHSGEVMNYIATSNNPSIGNYNVTSFCFIEENKLWVGIYGGGLNLFDTEKREFVKRYLSETANKYSLNDNNVLDIFKDKKGIIWIATVDGGLNRFEPEANVFKAYLQKDGLPSNSIYGIVADDSENLWLGTQNGLARFNTTDETIKYYDTSDGLIGFKFEPRSAFKNSKGLIFLGTSKGVVYFNSEKINDNLEEPHLLLTSFEIDNKELDYSDEKGPLQKHITFTNSVELKHNQTNITIEYVALNYISSKKNKYAFRMAGLESDWREVGSQRVANYSHLPAGDYTFMVKASNNDGVWTSKPLTLDIKVLPHPLKSNLAYSIFWVLFLLLNISIILLVKWLNERKHDMKLLQIERDTEKQLTQFKLQFFTNISHELRTLLSLIVHPINKLLKKKNRSTEDQALLTRIDLNVTRLLKLTDEIIDFRKVEQGKTRLELQKSNIVKFLQEINSLFIPIAREHEIKFEFQAYQPVIFWCFDKEKLQKILFNLLSNALKYTHDGGWVKLSVTLLNAKNESDEKLRIAVEDNGVGIEREHLTLIFDRFFNPGKDQQKHDLHGSSGIGLALVKQLVELHGGQIYVESEFGGGSRFYFDLTKLKDDCEEFDTALPDASLKLEKYDKWEEILKLERSKFQDELVITNELKSDEVPRILVVDDNKEICANLNDSLKDRYKVFIAGNGRKALEIVDRENIDIVVSDIMMPVMDGIELCRNLKSNIETSHIPVVLLTAKSGIENELHGLRTGADAYITKPFNDEKVLLTVGNIIENRKKIQLLFKGDQSEKLCEPNINPLDKKLIDNILKIINLKISDTSFSVDELGKEAGLSRMHLFRKIKVLTGYSPSDFIKKIRLEKSKELIEKGELSISDIAYDTGFSSPGNFSTAFKKFYGDTPAHYRANHFKSSPK